MMPVLVQTRNITYKMAYNDSTCSCSQYWYIHLDVRRHFCQLDTATLCPYAVPFRIPMNYYVYVWLIPSHFFILCLYFGLNHLFSGLYLVHISNIIDQNKIWLVYNTDSKVFKFPGLVSSNSIFNIVLLKFHISKVQTLNFRYMKFQKNCFYIGGGDTRPLQIVAVLFNLTVD